MIKIDLKSVTLDQNELRLRLGGSTDEETLKLASSVEKTLKAKTECYFKFKETTINVAENTVDLGFATIQSRNLATNLKNSQSAFVVAVTLGHKCDLILRQSAIKSPLLQFVTDAVASTLIEAVCDYVQDTLPPTYPRFSAGYGDLPLEFQKPLLEFLKTPKITLTDSYLMIPSKSVTFIAGRKQ